ncbi:MFS transporter [Chloroflexota bacterium]
MVFNDMHLDTIATAGVKRNRTTTILLVILCLSFQVLGISGIALFLPAIRLDFGLSSTQGGSLSAATFMVYALMQIPAGYLTDRYGPKRLFFIGALCSSMLSFTFGLAAVYWQALSIQTIIGFFRALLFTPGVALLTGWFPANRRSTAMGLYLIGTFLGDIVLGIVGPIIVAQYSWRILFLSFASLGIITALVFLRFGKETSSPVEARTVTIHEVLQLFRYRIMWVCGGIQYIRLAVMLGIAFWLPSFLIDDRGLSLQLTGLLIAVRFALIAPSNLLGGYISDRLNNPTLVIRFSLIALAITTGLFAVVNSITVLIILIGINAIFVQMYFGPLFNVPAEILGTNTAGVSRGFSNLFANIGSFSFVYLLGALRDSSGSFESGFYTVVGACVIGLVFTIPLERMRRRAIEPGQ